MAIYMRCVKADIELAGNGAVDAVEDLAHNEPQKRGTDMAVYDRLQRDKPGQGSAGSQNMNTEPSPALGLGSFSSWHLGSLGR